MKLVIKNNSYDAILITDNNEKKNVDLRYYSFEKEEFNHSIYMFATMYDIFKLDKYDNFESCIAGLSLLGGIPKFEVKNTIVNYGGWSNSNWYQLQGYEEVKRISKDIKKFMKSSEYPKVETIYDCENDFDVLKATIFHFLSKKGKIKKCKNCGRWFMTTTRNDTEYCNRKLDASNEINLTCKDVGDKKSKINYKKNEVIRKKESIATQLSNYGGEEYRQDFLEKFRAIKDKYKDYKTNEKSKQAILKWLDNNTFKKIMEQGGVE